MKSEVEKLEVEIIALHAAMRKVEAYHKDLILAAKNPEQLKGAFSSKARGYRADAVKEAIKILVEML